MYIGHVGAALAAKRVRTSVGLLVLMVATYVPDWVDGGLCLAGVNNSEGMLSHSIPAVFLFAATGFALYAVQSRDFGAAAIVAGLIVSHMLLDWITGSKPTWAGGPMIGLGLYGHPVLDFVVEGVVIIAGGALYARTLPPRRRPWIDVAIMLGALLVLQLGIDVAHGLMKTLPKC